MTRSINAAAVLAAVILSFCFSTLAQAAVPDSLSYQGYVTDPTGSPIDGERLFRFSIYNVETDGSPLWGPVDQLLPVDQGLFTAELGGPHTPFPLDLFDTPLWLGIEVQFDGEMTPRRPLTSVAFSYKADDALSLQGQGPAAFDQSAHVTDAGNPHGVNAAQAGAVATGTFSGHTADASAHHVQTSIIAGLGLDGGGSSGDVTVSMELPLELVGTSSEPILSGINQAGGYGVYGSGFQNYGVHGSSVNVAGVFGYSIAGAGVSGLNGSFFNQGHLGGPEYGVFGSSTVSHAGYFDGSAMVTDDLLVGIGGNLGIGLTDPNRKLYVVSNAEGLDYALKLDNPYSPGIGQTGVGILFSTEGSGGGLIEPTRGKGGLAYVSTSTWNRGAFYFLQDSGANPNNPELADAVMTIANNGNVGVGTTTPSTALDIRRNGNAQITVDGGVFGDSGYDFDENDQKRWQLHFRRESNALNVRDMLAGTDTMTFESGTGRVGIGTSTPQTRLDVAGDVRVAGNIETTGNVTWPARLTYYSLTAADFVPEVSDYGYSNYGGTLVWRGYFGPVLPFYRFFAPVNLPHGAEVNKVISYWTDNAPEDCVLQLWRIKHSDHSGGAMATMATSGALPGIRLEYDAIIDDPIVDNDLFAYYLVLYHYTNTGDDVEFHTARIEYETTGN